MATISMAKAASTLHPANSGKKVPYVVEAYVDFAIATTTKGSALAAADVIEALRIPGNSVVTVSGVEVITALTGGATAVTVDLGTGVDADAFADGFDVTTAVAGTYSVKPAAGVQAIVPAAGDTLDVTIATATGTVTGGKVRVWALVTDISAIQSPGIVALKS